MRVLVLLTDAFGGHGGIAKFNRDLLRALCSYPGMERVVALPRLVSEFDDRLPENLDFVLAAARGKSSFVRSLWAQRHFHPDLVVCGHIHLLPLASLYGRLVGARVTLIIHGIEAWQPNRKRLVNHFARRISSFIAVSKFSRSRFSAWTGLSEDLGFILPNCVELEKYGPGPKNPALIERYGLQGQKVILTLGRLAAAERYKGFDEVLEVMPDLLKTMPNLTYIIAGDGADQPRLLAKAKALGLTVFDWSSSALPAPLSGPVHVVFTGRVQESEKADHYRLADAYVMPSRGEGFGIVYLEALACGIPVVGSKADGSADALKHGELGLLIDPANREDLRVAVQQVLRGDCFPGQTGIQYYSIEAFQERIWRHLAGLNGANR